MSEGLMPRSRITRLATLFCALWRSASGAVTIELAAVVLFLVPLALGAYDFGHFGVRRAVLTSAINAGAQYGMLNQSAASDLDKIIQVVRDEAGDSEGTMDVTARNYCSCSVGGGEVDCDGTCSDGKYAPRYLEITAADEIRLLFDYPGLPQSYPVSVESVTRVR